MAEKRGQYQYNDDGTSAQLVAGDISIEESKAIVPVDIQARLGQTIQTHTNVAVGPSAGSSNATWIDCDGFDKMGVTALKDLAVTSSVTVYWSNDGTTLHGADTDIVNSTKQQQAVETGIKARYAKIYIWNSHTAPITVNVWTYLKA